jgi:hypothetical protein
VAYAKGELASARYAFLHTHGYVGTPNDMLLAWLNHNDGITPGVTISHVGTGASVLTSTGTPKIPGTIVLTMNGSAANPSANPPFTLNSTERGSTGILGPTVPLVQPWGITLHFSAASIVSGDKYKAVVAAHPKSLNDAWDAFLQNKLGKTHGQYGTFNDGLRAYFVSLGLNTVDGAQLNDMHLQFWTEGVGPT